ncbi:MAG: response regulator transcription factor [Elusimicrobia bacterium]|nr:response regulator transcription factor [Elusimicrobiota bacterium]
MAPKRRVLVVEDEEEFQALIRHALETAGYEVRIAGNGAQGLALFASQAPDLVVLDANLPDMNGFDVCRLMTSGAGPAVPVLLCTIRSTVTPAAEGLAAGACDYIVKPFAIDDFQARVAAALSR